MSSPEFNWFQAIPASQFDPGTLSSSFQPIFPAGFPDNIKIMHLFNGGAVAVDVSFDGVNLAFVWAAGSKMIVDLQANHKDNSESGAGTLYGNKGQNVWVRTSVNPTFLTVGGFR
jgi:hypothetical protein